MRALASLRELKSGVGRWIASNDHEERTIDEQDPLQPFNSPFNLVLLPRRHGNGLLLSSCKHHQTSWTLSKKETPADVPASRP